MCIFISLYIKIKLLIGEKLQFTCMFWNLNFSLCQSIKLFTGERNKWGILCMHLLCSTNECINSVPKVELCCTHTIHISNFQRTGTKIPQPSFPHLFIYQCFIHFILSISTFLFLWHYLLSKELWHWQSFSTWFSFNADNKNYTSKEKERIMEKNLSGEISKIDMSRDEY